MHKNLLKLRKMVLALKETETDKGILIHDEELAVGIEVFMEDANGELQPAADGEYVYDNKTIVVAEGKVAEIREAEPEPEPEPSAEELLKQKFHAVKEKFEASYQDVENSIWKALAESGVDGYLIENTEEYAIVSEWGEDNIEHLYRYAISVSEEGEVTLGEKKEVRIEYVDIDAPANESDAEKDARVAELEAQVADLEAKLAESDARSADEELKMHKENPKSTGIKFNLFKK